MWSLINSPWTITKQYYDFIAAGMIKNEPPLNKENRKFSRSVALTLRNFQEQVVWKF